MTIAPGTRDALALDVVNTGTVIDGVTARIVGLPEHTVTSNPTMLPLFPDAGGQITLTVALPTTFPAGTHPMTVEVHSQQPETAPSYVNVDLDVPLAPALSITSRPELVRARRTARFVTTVTNRGNVLLDVALTATDPQQNCSATVQPEALSLPPGASAEVVVTVRGRRMIMGTDTDRTLLVEAGARPVARPDAPGPIRDLPVADAPADGAEDETALEPAAPLAEQVRLTFRQRPLVTRGILTALILLAIIALWAAAFLFGLSRVFAGDPLTKSAPLSFFAATPDDSAAGAAHPAGAAGSVSPGSGIAGSDDQGAAGRSGNGVDRPVSDAAAGATAGAVPAGALPKNGTLPAGVGGTISGTVTAASSGEPVGRILVTALRVKADGSTEPVASAASQTDGSYQVAGLFPGPYRLEFQAPGFRTTYFPAATDAADAKALTASAAAVNADGNAEVTGLPATISGTVNFGDVTTPHTGTVSARLLGHGPGSRADIPDVTTDADGQYTLPDLPAPGTYLLTFTSKGYETATLQATVTGGAHRFASTMRLSAGTASISGTVTDGDGGTTLGGVTVSTMVDGQQVSTGTPTTGNVGHFVIDDLPTPATYIITAAKDGYGQVSTVIDLPPGGQSEELTIPLLSGTGVVRGTVADQDGNGIGGATVTVGGLADTVTALTLTTQPVGSFRLTGLPVPGAYTLTVTAPGYAAQTIPIPLTTDAVLEPVTVTMTPSTGAITGTVTDGQGDPMTGVTVVATDGTKTWPVVTTSSAQGGSAGSFRISELPAGPYTVTASDSTGEQRSTRTTVDPGTPVTLAFTLDGGE